MVNQENKIATLEDRILGIGGTVDVSQSIAQQEDIRDGAWARVQGYIDYNQEQIENVREQLKVDIDYKVDNCEKTIFSNDCFDVVYGTGILHHLQIEKCFDDAS